MSSHPASAEPLNFNFDQANVKRNRVVGVAAVLAAAAALAFVLYHGSADAGISPNVESPGGAHYIPLQILGISHSIPGFAPLSPSQRHEVLITAKQAVSAAESSEGARPENGVTMTVAEGNVNNVSLAGNNDYYLTESPDWQPTYILVFSGPKLPSEGFSGTMEVVLINARQGTVFSAFIVDNLP
jgi:hypothetical protein